MKKIIFTITILSIVVGTAMAQDSLSRKRLENNIFIGTGIFWEGGSASYAHEPGIVLRLSYGLDISLNNKWSIMPGFGVRAQTTDIKYIGAAGLDADGKSMADIFAIGRYHFEYEGVKIVIGLGPMFSFMSASDTYYVDADPLDPIDGKPKFRHFDLGIQPSILFLHRKHFQWGLEGSIGLLNTMRQYPEYDRTGSKYFHYLALTLGWHF